jgi:hypothetical protein
MVSKGSWRSESQVVIWRWSTLYLHPRMRKAASKTVIFQIE